MNNFAIKIFIAVVLGVLIGGISFYFWKSKYVFPVPEVTAEKVDLKSGKEAEEAARSAKEAENNQAEIIGYIEKNINKLSGEKPLSGANWTATKIWFIDGNNFYADYRDNASNLRRILVFRPVGGKGAVYEVRGRFAPGEKGWILKSGADISGATPVRLYEKNDQTGEWIIK